jgi:Tfp pilus assembly protein PilV
VIGDVRHEDGFGLVELLIALAVLNIAILAIFATFNAGSLAMRRAGQVSTAETLAEKQLELYRALPYESIGLKDTLLGGADATGATHTGDSSWNGGTQFTAASCSASAPECQPVQTGVVGADGKTYRIDSYVIAPTPPSGGRPVKQATVAVRDATSSKLLARIVSTFDKSTGCGTGAFPCT